MKRKLIVLDIVLVAAIAGIVWQFRARWQSAEGRQNAFLGRKVNPVPPPPMSPLPSLQPAAAASYGEVAQKMLFSKDRNPDVIKEVAAPPPPKPMPPLPAAFGVIDLGDGLTVFLSESAGAASKPYKTGDKVGEFKILALNREEIAFEWDGKTIKKRFEELAAKPAQAAQQQQAAAQAPRPAEPAVIAVKAGPGTATGATTKACVPGDTTAPGTVVDGYKKVVFVTPMGQSCRWDAQ